jgi:hypothetical protein
MQPGHALGGIDGDDARSPAEPSSVIGTARPLGKSRSIMKRGIADLLSSGCGGATPAACAASDRWLAQMPSRRLAVRRRQGFLVGREADRDRGEDRQG